MMSIKSYHSATAFRRALEDRLKKIANEQSQDLQRLRRGVAFSRLLARLFQQQDPPWVLKGGHVMELRIRSARNTRDIDLGMRPSAVLQTSKGTPVEIILRMLREAVSQDLKDFFLFNIGLPIMDLDAAPYGGARYPVEVQMDGRIFVKFHLDISLGDVLQKPFEMLKEPDWLGFAGIASPVVPSISSEEHFAEKLHAYTLPRKDRENSRVKDLVDMALFVRGGNLDRERLIGSIQDTFHQRNTHPLPKVLTAPPDFWQKPFAEMAEECGLDSDINKHFAVVSVFLVPILSKTK